MTATTPILDTNSDAVAELVTSILTPPQSGQRRVVAIVGPPASGKSTLASTLVPLFAQEGLTAQVVPMDGFHLDNRILIERDLLHRKGAPETFDAAGFATLVARLRDAPEIVFPLFDRNKDLAVAGAGVVTAKCDVVLVEGNYLLLDAPIWRDLRQYWDVSIFLETDVAELRARLIQRWLDHGLALEQATKRAEENDLVNLDTVVHGSARADLRFISTKRV